MVISHGLLNKNAENKHADSIFANVRSGYSVPKSINNFRKTKTLKNAEPILETSTSEATSILLCIQDCLPM